MRVQKILLSFVFVVSAMGAFAQEFPVDNLNYSVSAENEVSVSAIDNSISGDVTIPSTVTWTDSIGTTHTFNVTEISNSGFENCMGLTSIDIPSSVTRIGDLAFSACTSLASATIPSSVTRIGSSAFRRCASLTSINIPSSVTSIDAGVFMECTGLTSIDIPSTVTSIGDNAFGSCISLASINIPSSVTSIGSMAFMACSGLKDVTVNWPTPLPVSSQDNLFLNANTAACTLHVPAGTEALYKAADVWKEFNIPGANSLSVSTSSLDFAAFGEEKTFNITSNTDWTVSSSDSLFTVSPASGSNDGEVTVTAAENTTAAERTATITISGTGVDTKTITVTQAAATPTSTLSVSPSSLSFKATGEQKTFGITSNVNWTATTGDSWLTLSPASGNTDGTVTVTAAENTSTTSRTGSITVKGGDITQTVTVAQEGAPAPPTEVLPSSITLNESSITLTTSEQKQLTATVLPADATDKSVKWSSENTAIATVDANGLVSAVSAGSTIIIVEAVKNGVKATCTVTVIDEQTIIVEPSEPVNNQGTIDISLNVPTDQTFTVSFAITLPEGFSLDPNATSLVEDLMNAYTLVITPNGSNSWKFEIRLKSLRADVATTYREIVRIAYTVEEDVKSGQYNTAIEDVKLQFNDGTTIVEDEIIIPLTVTSPVGNTSIDNDIHVYFQNDILFVNTAFTERIEVYSINGYLLYQADKPAGEITCKINNLPPNGIIIIKGSSGWVKKIVK